MSDATQLSGPEYPPADGTAPDRLIVFLHGLGADGNDLIGLAPLLAQAFPTAQFLAPDAPFACDMGPMGRQWFSMEDRSRESLQAGIEAVAPTLDAYLDQQMDRFGLTPDRVAVFGFSQGTMLALSVLPKRPEPVAGLLGYSGMLVSPEALADGLKSRPPVFLIHGEADQVVPAEMSKFSGQALKTAGFDVEAAICRGVAHTIDETGLRMGVEFLLRAFGDKSVDEPATT